MNLTRKCFLGAVLVLSVFTISAQSGRWNKIAELDADVSLERTEIRCADQGAFKSLKFHVKGSDVDFERIFVKYGTGSTDDLKFSQTVRSGSDSGVLDLRGNKRIIKEIVVYYKSEGSKGNSNGKGKGQKKGKRMAKIEVWGQR